MAIPNRPCELAAISWRFRGDLSQQNRRDFKHAQILRRFTGVFFRLRVTNRHDIATSLHRRFKTPQKSLLKSPQKAAV